MAQEWMVYIKIARTLLLLSSTSPSAHSPLYLLYFIYVFANAEIVVFSTLSF